MQTKTNLDKAALTQVSDRLSKLSEGIASAFERGDRVGLEDYMTNLWKKKDKSDFLNTL